MYVYGLFIVISTFTPWGWVTHICVGTLTIIGSDNGLSPGWRQAIIWTNASILVIGPLGTKFSVISIRIQTFSLKKMHLPNIPPAKWHQFFLGLDLVTKVGVSTMNVVVSWKLANGQTLLGTYSDGKVWVPFIGLVLWCMIWSGCERHDVPAVSWN